MRSNRPDSSCGQVALGVGGWGVGERVGVCPTMSWQRHTVTWTVPQGVGSNEVDLVLLRFGGADLTLRNPSLELHRNNAWNKLSPLMPAGITITLRDPLEDPAPSTLQWIPDGTWDRVRLPGHPTTGAQLAVTIHIERGLEVGIRNAMLTSVDGRPQPVIRYPRPKLWFYHPNLLAHTMAMAGLLTTLGPIGIAIGAIPIAAAGLWITR